jgi:hypothetical protein
MTKRMRTLAGMDHGSHDNHTEKARAAQSRPTVRVECPGEGDVIARPSYTFKIAAMAGAEGVEVSIDRSRWMPCREALGLWWFDWSGFGRGEHELVARTRMGDDLATQSPPRRFSVD